MPATQKKPEYNFNALKGKEIRRAKDHLDLHELCSRSDIVSYEAPRRKGEKPPESYLIHYNGIRSIIGIDHLQYPRYGDKHVVRIDFPEEYPNAGSMPLCFMQTDIWHPNIKSSGPAKGHICINPGKLGAWQDLYMLVIRIGEIIQYKNYLAEQIPPFPEDEVVAQWVRDFAEPRDIVNYQKKIATDTSDLIRPLKGFEPRKNDTSPDALPEPVEELPSKIKIRLGGGVTQIPPDPGSEPSASGTKIKIKISK